MWQWLHGGVAISLLEVSLAPFFVATALDTSLPVYDRLRNLIVVAGLLLTAEVMLFWSLRRRRTEKVLQKLVTIAADVEMMSTSEQATKMMSTARFAMVFVQTIYTTVCMEILVYLSFPIYSGKNMGSIQVLENHPQAFWITYFLISLCTVLGAFSSASFLSYSFQTVVCITSLFQNLNANITHANTLKQLHTLTSLQQRLLDVSREFSDLCSRTHCAEVAGLVSFLVTNTAVLMIDFSNLGLIFVSSALVGFIYLLCALGQSLADATSSIGNAAYHSCWIHCEYGFRKHVMFIIHRSQAPTYLKAGMAGELDLQKFVKAMKLWYQFLQALLNLT